MPTEPLYPPEIPDKPGPLRVEWALKQPRRIRGRLSGPYVLEIRGLAHRPLGPNGFAIELPHAEDLHQLAYALSEAESELSLP